MLLNSQPCSPHQRWYSVGVKHPNVMSTLSRFGVHLWYYLSLNLPVPQYPHGENKDDDDDNDNDDGGSSDDNLQVCCEN